MVQPRCLNCQSNNVVGNIRIKVGAERAGDIRAYYKDRESDWLSKEARILGAICNNCGNVRLYIKERNKIWNT
jgi:hypothetical protein